MTDAQQIWKVRNAGMRQKTTVIFMLTSRGNSVILGAQNFGAGCMVKMDGMLINPASQQWCFKPWSTKSLLCSAEYSKTCYTDMVRGLLILDQYKASINTYLEKSPWDMAWLYIYTRHGNFELCEVFVIFKISISSSRHRFQGISTCFERMLKTWDKAGLKGNRRMSHCMCKIQRRPSRWGQLLARTYI